MAVGIEEEKQNNQKNELLIDMLDFHLARISQMINNVYYRPDKLSSFLYLNHDQKQTVQLTDAEKDLDAKLRAKAQAQAKLLKAQK